MSAKNTNSHLRVRMLCEGAMMVALAQVLSYIKLMELPNGGSLTPAMFPIILFAVRWGLTPGLMAGFTFGLLQLIFDGAYAWGWQSMLLDYLVAFTPLGLAGLFKGKKWGIFVGTANCLAEMKYGPEVKAVGTVAHSFIEFFPTEFDAFKAFADTYPDSVSLLLDTYNIMESGLPNLIKLDDYLIKKYPNDPSRRVKSARIDSGDLARGSKRLRKALDAAGKPYIKLVASNGLDEKKIANMELYEHAHFDSYGVGENLITSASDPVFGGVYKLVAVKRPDGTYQPKMKCSDSASKAIIPGKKMPWRLYDENGQAQCDLIAMDGEKIEAGKPVTMVNLDSDAIERTVTITPTKVKKLLVPHILHGELAMELPSIAEKKAYIARQLTDETWESELRLECPHKHYVNMTPAVAECRSRMYAELHGGKV